VDTHVYRVSRRLGLLAERVSPEKAQTILEMIVPVEKYLSFHLNLIKHGRLICRARGPRHEECALRSYCDCYLRSCRVPNVWTLYTPSRYLHSFLII
jgi:endonuclease-3